MEENKMINDFGTVGICVDFYGPDTFEGRAFFGLYEKPVVFYSLAGLITEVHKALDTCGVPQPFMEYRTFDKPHFYETHAAKNKHHEFFHHERFAGKRGTFVVKILYRQSASWQGTVQWVEGDKSQDFRSALELYMLISSAL